jgi:hypothetical protein
MLCSRAACASSSPPHHLRAAAADETRGERPPRPPDFHLAAAAPDAWRAAGAAGHGSREHVQARGNSPSPSAHASLNQCFTFALHSDQCR